MSEQAIGIRTNWLHMHIELGDILQIDRIMPEGQPTLVSVVRVIDRRVAIIEGVLRPSCYLGAMRPLMSTFTSLLPYLYDRATYSRLPDSLRT